MRIFVVQEQFEAIDGHYFQECVAWRQAAQRHDIALDIFASRRLDAATAAQVGAHRVFDPLDQGLRARYGDSDGRWAGMMRYTAEFMMRSRIIENGCREMSGACGQSPDLVVFPFADAAAMNGAAEWIGEMAEDRRPVLAFNFHRPEMSCVAGAGRKNVSGDINLLMFAGRRLASLLPPGGLIATAIDPRLANFLTNVTRIPCTVGPMLQFHGNPTPALRDASSAAYPVVSAMGIARQTKGGELLLQVINGLRRQRPDATAFMQIMHDPVRVQLQTLFTDEGAKVSIGGTLTMDDYYAQVAGSDLILMPYKSRVYALQSSGVFSDAVGAGVPVVCPDNTWLSDRLAEGWGAGETFAEYAPAPIVAAVVKALERLPALRAKAQLTAERWRKTHTVDRYLELLLRLAAAQGAPVEPMTLVP